MIGDMRESYKGYIINLRAVPTKDGAFTAHGSIEKHTPSYVDDTPFETGERHPTEDAAVKAGIGWAKKKIEGD